MTGLIVGGVIMAPIAARLAGRLPHAPMGTMVGGLVILVNGITIVTALGGVPGWVDAVLILLTVAVTGAVVGRAWRRELDERAAAVLVTSPELPPGPDAARWDRSTPEPI